MTQFFLRRSVEKAFQLDEPPSGLSLDPRRPITANPPHITSAVDDIMYIVNKVLQQSLDTGQLPVVTNVVPTIGRVLGTDFVGMIRRKMRDESYPKPAAAGGSPPDATVVSFLVLINNLDVAVDYVHRIVQPHIEPPTAAAGAGTSVPTPEGEDQTGLSVRFPLGKEVEQVLEALRAMESSFEKKVQDLVNDSINVVFKNVIHPRLRPILAEAFRDTEYGQGQVHGRDRDWDRDHDRDMDDATVPEDVAAAGIVGEGESVVRQRFAAAWQDLLGPISRILTGRGFDRLLGVALGSVARLVEKRLWSYHGRIGPLGAMQLERDVTGIVNAAVGVAGAAVEGARYRHREVFARCLQIALVIGLDEEEWEEVQRDGGEVVDRLSREEQQRARALLRP